MRCCLIAWDFVWYIHHKFPRHIRIVEIFESNVESLPAVHYCKKYTGCIEARATHDSHKKASISHRQHNNNCMSLDAHLNDHVSTRLAQEWRKFQHTVLNLVVHLVDVPRVERGYTDTKLVEQYADRPPVDGFRVTVASDNLRGYSTNKHKAKSAENTLLMTSYIHEFKHTVLPS